MVLWMRGYEASPGSSILVEVVPYKYESGEALSNEPISDSFTFMAGIAQYRFGKVVSAWRMSRMLFQYGAIRHMVEVL
jgi:hypothetical protein